MDTIRLANATDAPAIADLQITNWQRSHPAIAKLLDHEDVQSQWADAITRHSGSGRVLVCERGGAVVGVAAIEFGREAGRLSLLEVEPAVRRQLIGSRLLNAVADIAAQAGCLRLSAWLSTDQSGGRLFLESTGWVTSGATRTVSTDTEEKGQHGEEETGFTEDQQELTTSLAT